MNWPLTIRIPIRARGKGRPRVCKSGTAVFTPPDTAAFERTVANVARREMRLSGNTPLDDAVAMLIAISIRPSKARAIADPCTVKPDIDNAAKAILDALSGIVYTDDKNVVHLTVTKEYAHEDSITITVQPFAAPTLEELTHE